MSANYIWFAVFLCYNFMWVSFMVHSRSELSEKAMVILYQINICKEQKMDFDIEKIIHDNLDIDNEFVKDLVFGVITYKEELDKIANKYMKNWTIERLDKTGCAILEIALYELKYTDTPEVVVINEAIELSKKYSDDNVRKIINAVLDKVIKEQ